MGIIYRNGVPYGGAANAVRFKGGFAASGDGTINGGTTTLKSVKELVGDMYVCTSAGTIYGMNFEIGDSIIFRATVAAGTVPATATGTPPVSTDFITVEGESSVSVVDANPTLSCGASATVATIEGVDIHVTMPSKSTDTIYSGSGWSAGTLPAATVASGVLSFSTGTLPALTLTSATVVTDI